eukprot:m.542534 g.542534  ORF g.542534 m.542534 type:complete len:89 (+) comp57656_c0_seq34:1384-1650(+)
MASRFWLQHATYLRLMSLFLFLSDVFNSWLRLSLAQSCLVLAVADGAGLHLVLLLDCANRDHALPHSRDSDHQLGQGPSSVSRQRYCV